MNEASDAITNADVARLDRVEQFGGFLEELHLEWRSFHDEFTEMWERDHRSIGRFIQSQLLVEHFLTELLARMSGIDPPTLYREYDFFDRVEQICKHPQISHMKSMLHELRMVRNDLVHKLRFDFGDEHLTAIRKFVGDFLDRTSDPVPDGIELVITCSYLTCMMFNVQLKRDWIEPGSISMPPSKKERRRSAQKRSKRRKNRKR